MSSHHVVLIRAIGPRPEFYRVAEHLWGDDCDFDSDGDSQDPGDRNWTELSLSLRGPSGENLDAEHLDIDPVSLDPLVLAVRSPQQPLCQRAAEFIISCSGGTVEHAGA
ncbi:hypothetical protein SAMN04487938_2571 [Lysobacter sp. cf310]|nr:hypothetical protein SAMN04487938_2571 [Lysobacter sp. cf310]